MGPIAAAALKVAISGAVVVVVFARTRNIPRSEMGLVWPPLASSLLFLILYAAWMFGSDAAIHWRGPWDWQPWRQAPLAASAMRVLAVCFPGPTAEELVFRGWFFGLLEKRVGVALTIVATAVGWAALHYTYGMSVILVIVVDGLLLGAARFKTRSVFPPIAMHALYNLYAIW